MASNEGINALQLRVLARARSRHGYDRMIGAESRTETELVEAGDLFQEIAHGEFYRFTLSPTGRRRLDVAEAAGWHMTDPLPSAALSKAEPTS